MTLVTFAATTKMADIIHANHTLLSVLPRFGITLGFGEKSLTEVCKQHGVDPLFFTLVINIYSFDDYLPLKTDLLGIQMTDLVEYLKKSHEYYLEHKMLRLEKCLQNFHKTCDSIHSKLIERFFTEYKQEVVSHLDYEDKVVFPYITQLISGSLEQGYHINQYEDNHSNIDDKLNDLTNIIIKYLPENDHSEERSELLMEIFMFEEELAKHTRMEDKILIPLVENIEHRYEK
ncbi:MAG: hemerythrin domain-containing protein [Bacteroidales bacterium]